MLAQLLKETLKIQKVRKRRQGEEERVKIKRVVMYLSHSGHPHVIHQAPMQPGPTHSTTSTMCSLKELHQLLHPLVTQPLLLFLPNSRALVHLKQGRNILAS